MSLSEVALLSALNDFVIPEPFYDVVHLGGEAYRCFVRGDYTRKELLYEVGSFEQNGVFIQIKSVGFTASDSIVRYFDVYANELT